MKTDASLQGRCALVTGGSRGIGRAIAEALAESGCKVALASRRGEDCLKVAEALAARFGVAALGLTADVSRHADVVRMFHELRRWSADRLDVLVNNAGYPFDPVLWNTALDATPPEKLRSWYLSVFETDTLGSVFCTHEALPLMKKNRKGSIIYVSSASALEGYEGSPYTVAKAGILGLMKDVARKYGPFGIRANALAPGSIRTPATYDKLETGAREKLAKRSPLDRWGEPEEVARAALFLASDASGFVSGQTIVIDGGAFRR